MLKEMSIPQLYTPRRLKVVADTFIGYLDLASLYMYYRYGIKFLPKNMDWVIEKYCKYRLSKLI